jgi:hypothetical protein
MLGQDESMTRIRAIVRITAILSLFAVVPPLPSTAQQLVFESFPVSAVVRGENVWLRLDPAAETEVIALLQRGDPITITGESTFDGDEEYYPVESDLTGETGWVGALFIDPRSIAGASTVVVPLDEVDAAAEDVAVDEPADQRQQDREARRAARQAEQDQEQAPAAEAEDPADDRAARRAARQTESEASDAQAGTEQPADDRAARRAARQADQEANADGANASADALTFSGTEPTVTPEFTAPADVMTVTANHEGDGNFIVLAVTPEGTEDFLFNEIGPFSGETTFEIAAGSTVVLDVEANGPWEVIIEPAF